jgi:hypothetical protein
MLADESDIIPGFGQKSSRNAADGAGSDENNTLRQFEDFLSCGRIACAL